MTETELKIRLTTEDVARLVRHPALAAVRQTRPATVQLVSVYYDTEHQALAKHAIALRIRKSGRRWVQTVKKSPRQRIQGLFQTLEVDHPAPGGRLDLGRDDPHEVYAEIRGIVGESAVGPLFETRVRRTTERLRTKSGLVELAIDRGEVIAGGLSAPIREAEIELLEGSVVAIYDVARALFAEGPVRFSREPKSALGLRLARHGVGDPPLRPRKSGTPAFGPTATAEAVAQDLLRDCFAQIADNLVVVAESEVAEGAHQLRVGLRRLRTAIAVFRPVLENDALATLSLEARRIGQIVGRLRDLDVLAEEVVPGVAGAGLDGQARSALVAAIEARRQETRAEVRAALAEPATVRFIFDLAEAIEAQPWREGRGDSSVGGLDAPIGKLAPGMLDKRRRKAAKRGRGIETLSPADLHELRKELKKLRYAGDMLGALYPEKRRGPYLEALRRLQDTFGSLNDGTMAGEVLTGASAPGAGDPQAQRAAGWVLGSLAVKAADDRPRLIKAWRKLGKATPFWT
jgi:inorganic triphosphatase YgiF